MTDMSGAIKAGGGETNDGVPLGEMLWICHSSMFGKTAGGWDELLTHERVKWACVAEGFLKEFGLPASPLSGRGGEGKETGATLKGQATQQSPSQQVVSALTGECPSRGWQPMSSCPNDGRPVWIMAGSPKHPIRVNAEGEIWRSALADGLEGMPTHWHPDIAPPALGTEAEGQDATSGLVHEGPATQVATPSPTPTDPVAEARARLEALDPNCGPHEEYADFLHGESRDLTQPIPYRQDCLTRAAQIKSDLATLKGAHGEDRS